MDGVRKGGASPRPLPICEEKKKALDDLLQRGKGKKEGGKGSIPNTLPTIMDERKEKKREGKWKKD